MQYVIGIDGGGTKTRLFAMDRRMGLLYEARGGSSNLTSCGSEAVRKNLTDLLQRAITESGLDPAECAGICLGSAGAGRESARQELRDILREAWDFGPILVTDDAESALAGGTADGCGILLAAGTGSICYGKNNRGQARRVGGWGHIAGDEGSGYAMACQILQAVFRAWDGREPATQLTGLVLEHWGLRDMDGLVDCVYRSGKGKSGIASLAPLCDLAYEAGDRAAHRIIERCARDLAEMALTASALFAEGTKISCVYTGSLLTKSVPLRTQLEALLGKVRPEIALSPCLHDAAWGCARLAWDHAAEKGGRHMKWTFVPTNDT